MNRELLDKMWSMVEEDEEFKNEIMEKFKNKIRDGIDELDMTNMLRDELGKASESLAEDIMDEIDYKPIAEKLQVQIERRFSTENKGGKHG